MCPRLEVAPQRADTLSYGGLRTRIRAEGPTVIPGCCGMSRGASARGRAIVSYGGDVSSKAKAPCRSRGSLNPGYLGEAFAHHASDAEQSSAEQKEAGGLGGCGWDYRPALQI